MIWKTGFPIDLIIDAVHMTYVYIHMFNYYVIYKCMLNQYYRYIYIYIYVYLIYIYIYIYI